jgi:hypothetical protein
MRGLFHKQQLVSKKEETLESYTKSPGGYSRGFFKLVLMESQITTTLVLDRID